MNMNLRCIAYSFSYDVASKLKFTNVKRHCFPFGRKTIEGSVHLFLLNEIALFVYFVIMAKLLENHNKAI
jgi:hypothetical protein